MLMSTWSQKVCKNVERMIFLTGTNSPSTIYSYGNVSRSNFYDGKICMIVDIRVYSFVFFSRSTKLAETGHGFPEFRSLRKANKI